MPTGSDGGTQPPMTGSSSGASGQQAGSTTPMAASMSSSGGRGRGRRDHHFNRFGVNSTRRTTQPRFEGREPSLKGYIYNSTGEQNPDQYIKTTKEVINYVGRMYTKYMAEFTQAMRDLELVDPAVPANPDDATNVIALEVWKHEYKEHRI
jgi:hypothetical protein